MKASDILHKEVFDNSGKKVGRIYEIETQSGGASGDDESATRWQVSRLMVGPGGALLRLGYQRRHLRGPAGVKFLAERLQRFEIEWPRVHEVGRDRVTLNCSVEELKS